MNPWLYHTDLFRPKWLWQLALVLLCGAWGAAASSGGNVSSAALFDVAKSLTPAVGIEWRGRPGKDDAQHPRVDEAGDGLAAAVVESILWPLLSLAVVLSTGQLAQRSRYERPSPRAPPFL